VGTIKTIHRQLPAIYQPVGLQAVQLAVGAEFLAAVEGFGRGREHFGDEDRMLFE